MTLKKIRKALDAAALDILVLPGVLLILIFGYIPMVGIFLAFKKYRPALGIWGSEWCGFENFKAFFTSPDIWVITRNTVFYNLAFIFLGMVIALVFALLMNELTSRKSIKFYQTIAMMPHFLSYVIVAYILYTFLANSYGILNTALLPKLGIKPISWYSEPKYWPYIIFFVREWKSVGYGSVLYFACISGINPEYYEAAVIDGANRWQLATKVTVPMLKSIICIQLIMSLSGIFGGDLGLFYNVPMNQGELYPTTNILATYIYRNVSKVGFSTAAGLYSSLVGFVLVMISNAVVRKLDYDSALF